MSQTTAQLVGALLTLAGLGVRALAGLRGFNHR
jgi:hypothetical protein